MDHKEMSKKGGMAKSEAKAKAAKENAKKPRGKWYTSIAYELDGVEKHKAFGAVLAKGQPPANAEAHHEWVREKLRESGVGLREVEKIIFLQLATTSHRICK